MAEQSKPTKKQLSAEYAKVKFEGLSKLGQEMWSAESPGLLEHREIKMNAFLAGHASRDAEVEHLKAEFHLAEDERIEWVRRGERAEELNDELREALDALTEKGKV